MNRKRSVFLLLCLCLTLASAPVTARAADSAGKFKEEGGVIYYYQELFTIVASPNTWDYSLKYRLDDASGTAAVAEIIGPKNLLNREVQILDKITYQGREYTVTTIEDKVFMYCAKAPSFVLPETITTIGMQAFDHCESAEAINLPSGVTSIGYAAFNTCTSLKEIRIPEGIREIPGMAFAGCWAVSSLTIPDSVTTIGRSAFENLGFSASPIDLVIPNNVILLEQDSFRNANIRSLRFPAGRTEMLKINDAFPVCSKLEYIEMLTEQATANNVEFRGCSSAAVVLVHKNGPNLASVPTRIKYEVNADGKTATITYVGAAAISQTPGKIGEWYVTAVPNAYQAEGSHVCYFGENNELKYCPICSKENLNHTHQYGTEWQWNTSSHWHACTCGEKADETAHGFSEVIDEETPVSVTKHEQCACGYGKSPVKSPKTAPDQPSYEDLSIEDADHTPIRVTIHCAEPSGTTCRDSEGALLENADEAKSYETGEVVWDNTTKRWYCDVTVYADAYITAYSKTEDGEWTAHELAENESDSRNVRFWYLEEFLAVKKNPWRTESGAVVPNEITFPAAHRKISRTITCKVTETAGRLVKLSAEVSRTAEEGETIYYAVSGAPDAVPADSEFTAEAFFEGLEPDTDYYFWAKIPRHKSTGLAEAVSLPVKAATSHDWSAAWSHDDAHHWHECGAARCPVTENEQKSGYGAHTGGSADCSKKAVCSVCGAEYGTIDAANHTLTYHEKTEATCTADGQAEHWSCSICKKNYSDPRGKNEIQDIVIPKTGHVYGIEWEKDDVAHWHACTCGERAGETAHAFSWVVDKEATETESGSRHEECAVCGYKRAAVEIPATGTDPTKPEDPTDPTKPEDPTDPTKPEGPTDPTRPEDPTDPTKPEDPTDPAKPADPTKPTDSTKPEDPAKPTEAVRPTSPATDDGNSPAAFFLLFMAGLGLMGTALAFDFFSRKC